MFRTAALLSCFPRAASTDGCSKADGFLPALPPMQTTRGALATMGDPSGPMTGAVIPEGTKVPTAQRAQAASQSCGTLGPQWRKLNLSMGLMC